MAIREINELPLSRIPKKTPGNTATFDVSYTSMTGPLGEHAGLPVAVAAPVPGKIEPRARAKLSICLRKKAYLEQEMTKVLKMRFFAPFDLIPIHMRIPKDGRARDRKKEQKERERGIASRSVHKLTVDEKRLILFHKIQAYQDARRKPPRTKVFTSFRQYLEDGLRYVELAIREITMIATKDLQDHPDPSSIVAVEKRLHPAFTLNLPTPKPSPDSDADEDDTFASLRPDLRRANTNISPSATIPPRKLEFLRDMSRKFLRNIYCHVTDLADPDIMGQSRRATGKDSGAGHARNRKQGQKERERQMVDSFKKVHIRDKK